MFLFKFSNTKKSKKNLINKIDFMKFSVPILSKFIYDEKIIIKKNNNKEILVKLNLNFILLKIQNVVPKTIKIIMFKFTNKLPTIKEIGKV